MKVPCLVNAEQPIVEGLFKLQTSYFTGIRKYQDKSYLCCPFKMNMNHMKKIVLTIVIAAFTFIVNAQPPEGDAKKGDWYGEKISTDGAVALNTVAAKLSGTEAIETKVKAKIVDVCPNKGCWLKLELENGETAMVKMKDYGFFLPLAAIGKTVVIDGEMKMKTTSVSELRHYAEDAKKSKEEIAAITQPKKEVSVLAKGIVVVE